MSGNMITLALFSLFFLGLGVLPTNAVAVSGVSVEHRAIAGMSRHANIARRSRRATNAKRCVKKGSTSSIHKSSSTAAKATPKAIEVVKTSTKSSTKAATTTKAAAKATQSTTSTSKTLAASQGGKVGLGWGVDAKYLKNFATKGAPVYNWTPEPPMEAVALGMNPVPMLWGAKNLASNCGTRCFSQVKKGGPYDTVMGMNEPNQAGQSDMSYQEGIAMWKAHIEPLATGTGALRTVSPATTSNPNGLVWMKNFVAGCTGCHIDVIALHWYDVDAQAFITYVKNFYAAFKKPIWVTEFACQNMNDANAQCDQAKTNAFMKTVTEWMDATDYVERYFAYGIEQNLNIHGTNLLIDGSSHEPTPYGDLFLHRS